MNWHVIDPLLNPTGPEVIKSFASRQQAEDWLEDRLSNHLETYIGCYILGATADIACIHSEVVEPEECCAV
jgi:hypothetical protein